MEDNKIMEPIAEPIPVEVLKAELTPDKKLRMTNKSDNEVYVVTWHDSPHVVREIGRLREIAFRAAGGGTGKSLDLDEFDTMENPYKQLLVWDPEAQEILGGYRYLLGTRGEHPLICVGINPSTARPDHLDPTLQSVERIALRNGFDSFMMLNLCAQRATDPNDMTRDYPMVLREGNVSAFEYALCLSERPVVWAAWGTMIEKRPYLRELLEDLVGAAERYHAEWVSFGPRSKKGHPHHPLYLRQDAAMAPFDVHAYLMV